MPNPTETTLAQLREQVKTEARISGSTNLDPYIDNLINELLVQSAWKHRYFELLVLNEEITMVADTSAYSLPTNFMLPRLVRYRHTAGNLRILKEQGSFVTNPYSGVPRYYMIAGGQINLTPATNILADEALVIDYYTIPETLTADDPFPLPRAWVPIKQEAIARAHIYNKELASAQALAGSAGRTENKVEGST